jgi:hypothetical protein
VTLKLARACGVQVNKADNFSYLLLLIAVLSGQQESRGPITVAKISPSIHTATREETHDLVRLLH